MHIERGWTMVRGEICYSLARNVGKSRLTRASMVSDFTSTDGSFSNREQINTYLLDTPLKAVRGSYSMNCSEFVQSPSRTLVASGIYAGKLKKNEHSVN